MTGGAEKERASGLWAKVVKLVRATSGVRNKKEMDHD